MRDRGVVLINALVVVLAISVVAAALLTRSEAARIRAETARSADLADLYLDAAEGLVPQLLSQVLRDAVAHSGQDWAQTHRFEIGRGTVTVKIQDLQGRLNVNWLGKADEFAADAFQRVFADVGLSQALVSDLAAFVGPEGPSSAPYMSRRPPVLPRGGPLKVLEDARAMESLRPGDFAVMASVASALPPTARVNLNTAPAAVKAAMLAPLPREVADDVLAGTDPIRDISQLRRQTMEVLETEDVDHLPFDRMTVTSEWFRATLTAEIDGQRYKRITIHHIDPVTAKRAVRTLRWAEYD